MIGTKHGTEAADPDGLRAARDGRRALLSALKAYRKERWSGSK